MVTRPMAMTKDGVSVSGMISDFMTPNGAKDWTVELMANDTNNTAADGVQTPLNLQNIVSERTDAPAPLTDAMTKWDTGGAVPGTGVWNAQFWGIEKDTSHPKAITGEFDAAISGGTVGQIVGAFGANKVPETE